MENLIIICLTVTINMAMLCNTLDKIINRKKEGND